MQFLQVFFLLAFVVSSALAATAPVRGNFTGPANTTKYMTEGAQDAAVVCEVTFGTELDFVGDVYTFPVQTGLCYDFPYVLYETFNDRISSIAVDPGNGNSNINCSFYVDATCQGSSYITLHDNDLGDGDGSFNDVISSWGCYK